MAGRQGAVPTTMSALLLSLILVVSPVMAANLSIPPEVDPGTPTYVGLDDPVPDEPVPFDPAINMLQAIHDADVPGSWVLQYWDGSAWVEVSNPSGYATEADQYNVATHDPVTTRAMRVTVQTAEGVTAVGALQWKVFEPGS